MSFKRELRPTIDLRSKFEPPRQWVSSFLLYTPAKQKWAHDGMRFVITELRSVSAKAMFDN